MLVTAALARILVDPAGTQRMAAMTSIAASGLVANFELSNARSPFTRGAESGTAAPTEALRKPLVNVMEKPPGPGLPTALSG